MSKIQVPDILDLIHRFIAKGKDDEAAVRSFFNIQRKPGKQWIDTLRPGVDAAQRILGAHIEEQQPSSEGETEANERAMLCAELFGSGNDTLRQLVKSVKTNDLVRVIYEKHDDSDKRSVKVEQFKTKPTNEDPAEKQPKITEPPEGLVPARNPEPQYPDAILPMLEALRPRVRLGEDQSPQAIVRAILEGRWSRRVSLLLPMYKDINPSVAWSLMANVRKQPWLGVHYEPETLLQRARNVLVKTFLATEAEWSVWYDSDNIAPFGDPHFFFAENRLCADPTFLKPEFASLMAIEHMMKAGKTIVGGVYQMRRKGDVPMVIQPHLHPRHQEDRDLVKKLLADGPFDRVVQVGYVATGCALVHRSVYEDIQKKFPELAPKTEDGAWDFFGHDLGLGGEDIHFCKLAAQAGHASFLDCAVWACHIGNYPFWPQRKRE